MKVTAKIWLSISFLFVGYFGTSGLNFVLGVRTEHTLQSTADERVPAAFDGQAIVVHFRSQLKLYEESVIMGDEDVLEKAKTESENT